MGHGVFGDIYDQFKGKPREAIAFLRRKKGGEATAALRHKDIGDIDLVWGEEGTGKSDGFGLARLAKYHPEVLDNLQGILDDMHVTQRTENRIRLESDTHQAAVRLTWDNQKKNWLLTAYEKKNSALDNTTDTGKTSERGKQNDTATLQGTVSVGKDRYLFGNEQEKTEKSGVVIDDLSLYNVSMHKKKTPTNTGLNSPMNGLGSYSVDVSAYKVKDLIHSTQENDQKLLGISKDDTSFSFGNTFYFLMDY